MAYVEMFGCDLSRMSGAIKRMNESTLEAVVLAGACFPIDLFMTKKARFPKIYRQFN